MKKWLAVVLVFVMAFGMAGGAVAEIDVESMTIAELFTIRDKVNARINELNTSIEDEDGSVALSKMPHEAVLQRNDRRIDFLLLDHAKDLNGEFHPDIMYQDVSDGHFPNECLYPVNGDYSRLTGVAFFGFVKEALGNRPTLEIRGDGAVLYTEKFDAHTEGSNQIYEIDIDVSGYEVIGVSLASSAEHGFYLSNMRFTK